MFEDGDRVVAMAAYCGLDIVGLTGTVVKKGAKELDVTYPVSVAFDKPLGGMWGPDKNMWHVPSSFLKKIDTGEITGEGWLLPVSFGVKQECANAYCAGKGKDYIAAGFTELCKQKPTQREKEAQFGTTHPLVCKLCKKGWGIHTGAVCFRLAVKKPQTNKVKAKSATPVPVPLLVPVSTGDARTQKVRGVVALSKDSQQNEAVPSFTHFPAVAPDFKRMIGKFCRPCPVRPRHGFVDSRMVGSAAEAADLVAETLRADEEAEVLVMPKIEADWSAVWTPGILTLGTGHDGATAGKGSLTLPAIGQLISSETLKLADISTAPYVEIVYGKHAKHSWDTPKFGAFLVQLRDGPMTSAEVDYVTEPVTVSRVLRVDNQDLLAWERVIKDADTGTVVWHPGGSLASHYAVHAVARGLAVLVSREPVVGETITPTTTKPQVNYDELKAGFLLGAADEYSEWVNEDHTAYQLAVHAMLAGCHHTAVWLGRADRALGYAMGTAWRLTVTAALGEYRHYGYDEDTGEHDESITANSSVQGKSRDTVYAMAWNKALKPRMMDKFIDALTAFSSSDGWSQGFGGLSWYKACIHALNMFNAVCDDNAADAVSALNQLVHSAHNNGWLFNKFAGQDAFDTAVKNPIEPLVKTGPWFYRVTRAVFPAQAELNTFFVARPVPTKKEKLAREPRIAETQKPKKVIAAQAAYSDKTQFDEQSKVHIQVHIQFRVWGEGKTAYYHSIDVAVAVNDRLKKLWQELADADLTPSWSGADSKYVPLHKLSPVAAWGLAGVAMLHTDSKGKKAPGVLKHGPKKPLKLKVWGEKPKKQTQTAAQAVDTAELSLAAVSHDYLGTFSLEDKFPSPLANKMDTLCAVCGKRWGAHYSSHHSQDLSCPCHLCGNNPHSCYCGNGAPKGGKQ